MKKNICRLVVRNEPQQMLVWDMTMLGIVPQPNLRFVILGMGMNKSEAIRNMIQVQLATGTSN